ncbi:MAG: HAD family hydrolase [archaeon]|jgi:phosphoglycolate phosphatase
MIRAIIFDSDGTLFDSGGLGKTKLAKICEKNNLVFDEEKYKSLTGFTRKDKIAKMFPLDFDIVWPLWDKAYSDNYAEFAQIYPNVFDTIKKLKEQGILLFIFSTKYSYLVKQALDKFEVSNYFQEIIGGEFEPIKPAPVAVENILKKYGLEKDELLLVGDSEVDKESAQNANIKFVLIDYKKKSQIKEYYKKIESLSELENILIKLNKN